MAGTISFKRKLRIELFNIVLTDSLIINSWSIRQVNNSKTINEKKHIAIPKTNNFHKLMYFLSKEMNRNEHEKK